MAITRTLAKHQRGHLSREVITEAGLNVARGEGVQNLTMKRLATELSVTPMAIYRHFEDKSDLIDAVLNEYVKQTDICNHQVSPADWANWLTKTYSKMYEGLQSMPSLYPYIGTASRFGPSASEVVTKTLEVLQNAGFNLRQATQAANALNGFIIGCAIMDNAFYESLTHADMDNLGDDPQEVETGLDTGLRLIISALEIEHKIIKDSKET